MKAKKQRGKKEKEVGDEILSEELREQLGSGTGSIPLVLPGKKKKEQKKEPTPEQIRREERKRKSRAQKVRDDKMLAKRRKIQERESTYASLAHNSLSREERELLVSSGKRGQSKTKKQKLKEALLRVC